MGLFGAVRLYVQDNRLDNMLTWLLEPVRMGRKAKEKFISQHTATLLKSVRARSGLSIRDVAAKIGKSRQAVHVAEVRTYHASNDVIMAFASACGATRDELDRLPGLIALDKGRLEVPSHATEARVQRAQRVLDGLE